MKKINETFNYLKLFDTKNEPFEKAKDCDSRLAEMAWQDRTTFEAIWQNFGLSENEVKKKMSKLLSKKSYKNWRARVSGRKTKHEKMCDFKLIKFQGPW